MKMCAVSKKQKQQCTYIQSVSFQRISVQAVFSLVTYCMTLSVSHGRMTERIWKDANIT
jgi:hypothetical protein